MGAPGLALASNFFLVPSVPSGESQCFFATKVGKETKSDLDVLQYPAMSCYVLSPSIAKVQCYVFEASMFKSLQPIGAPGELCLGGDQLAQGYYRDAAKTAEKFVTNPLNGKRMYKTGDLVMWLPCGQLLYLGRNDEMVGASVPREPQHSSDSC